MSTGAIDTWTVKMAELGPLYPWPGSEVFWWIVGMALWILWHIIQMRRESREYEEEIKRYGDVDSLGKLLGGEERAN